MTSTFSNLDQFAVQTNGELMTLNLTQILLQHPRLLEEAAKPITADDAMASAKEAAVGADYAFMLIAGVVVFLMQSGFALLESGTVRFKNYQNVLLKNCLDACIGGIVWWAFGYGIAYGEGNGFFGEKFYFGIGFEEKENNAQYGNWFFQFAFAATAATIVSGSLAERVNIGNYLLFSFLMTGFIYPVVVASTWAADGWLVTGEWNGGVGYEDFAGSGIVHLTGGVAGFIGAWIIGPRIGLYPEEDVVVGVSSRRETSEPVYSVTDHAGYDNIA